MSSWPWFVSGPLIVLVMFLLLFFGGNFGVSANLRTLCSMCGAGGNCEFFDFNWKNQIWNLVFVLGGVLGGVISHNYLTTDEHVDLNPTTVVALEEQLGFEYNDSSSGLVPAEIFSAEVVQSPKGLAILIIGGLLIGFGTRYAGGCTSGHAISGLSNLQLPSLIAVVGFFIGGLLMTHLLLPLIFNA